MSAPFLSLAVLNYNEEDSMERAARLCSEVLQRCRITYELVLVDDGSTDGSRSIIERMTRVLPCCRAIYHRRKSAGFFTIGARSVHESGERTKHGGWTLLSATIFLHWLKD